MKTLLVAVGLCAGTSSVLADTETVSLLNIDYSTVTTPAWTVVGGTGSMTDGAWTHAQGGGGGNRSAYLDFGVASSIDDNWTVEFDATLKPGSDRNDQQVTVAGANTTYASNTSATGYMYFAVKEESNGGTTYTVKIGNTDVATGVTLSNGTVYHFKVSYDGTSAVTAFIGETKYEGTAAIANVGKLRGLHSCVARYHGAVTYDNIKVTKEVEAGSVDIPSASITAVDGINRTVSFTCPTDGVSFSYSTDGGTSWTDADYVVISENTDIIVKATKGSKNAQSDVLSFLAGTEIKLNTPTWVKTGYSAGVSTVELASDQSSKLLSPVADIYYMINGGAATKYTAAISVNDGEILSYYASAAGYTNSDEGSVTAVAPNSNPTLWLESYVATADKQTITRDGDAVITINTIDYFYMKAATDGRFSNYLLTSSADGLSNWLYRTGGIYGGGGQSYAINGLEKGDYVTITYSKGDGDPVPNATDGVKDEWNSTSTSMAINVTGTTGVLRFTIARYGYIKSIKVQRGVVTLTIGAEGYSTFASAYPLDLTATAQATAGIEAYKASVSGNKVYFTAIDQTVAANTGFLLTGTAGATVNIPVAATGTAVDGNDFLVNEGGATFVGDDDYYYFGLMKDSELEFGVFEPNTVAIPADKAYLKVLKTAVDGTARLEIVFADEATGIANINVNDNENRYYNLNGQRISQPTRGLYIMNGKKYVVK